MVMLMAGCSGLFKQPRFVLEKNGDPIHDAVLEHETNWRGTRYQWGGTSRWGIDCSAYMQRVFKDVFDVELPRTTSSQIVLGTRVSLHELQAGDLVFFQFDSKTLHVGVYLSKGGFAHAGYSTGVTLSPLYLPVWRDRFIEGRRIIRVASS